MSRTVWACFVIALLAGCALSGASFDGSSGVMRCDRNGSQEERRACD